MKYAFSCKDSLKGLKAPKMFFLKGSKNFLLKGLKGSF